jgi:hypothetical protein
MSDDKQCGTCRYFIQYPHHYAHVGSCEIRLPVWVAQDESGNCRNVIVSDACDLFHARGEE